MAGLAELIKVSPEFSQYYSWFVQLAKVSNIYREEQREKYHISNIYIPTNIKYLYSSNIIYQIVT